MSKAQKVASRRQRRTPALRQQIHTIQGIPVRLWTETPTLRQIHTRAYMGLFKVGCKVEHPTDRTKSGVIRDLMVDTGSEYTWINQALLRRLGIEVRKTVRLRLANGEVVTKSVGFAVLYVQNSITIDEVVFAEGDDMQLLGARALEGLNLLVDPKEKRLVPGGPQIAASAPDIGQGSYHAEAA